LKLGRDVPVLKGGPDPEKTDAVMLTRNRISRIYYHRHFFDYPVKMNLNTILNMGWWTTIRAGFSYLCATVCKLPETSLENFYINRFGRKLYSMFFEGYTEKLWGRHPRNISADWGAQRVKGLSIIAVIKDILGKMLPKALQKHAKKETSLIEAFQYPKFGPGQLWQTAAFRFEEMGGHILFNCKATVLKRRNERISSVIYECQGLKKEFFCDCVISSMPLKDLVAGLDDVPDAIKRIAIGLPYRDFVTVGLLVDRLNLKNETKLKTLGNIVPDCWIYVQDVGVRLGRIQVFNNWSPYMVKSPENTIWMGLEYFCNEGDELWRLSEEEWRALGVSELVKMGVLGEEASIIDFHVEKVKKAYPAYFDTYSCIGELTKYLDSIPNLYCVGRNGQHRYNNMDHSMVTAFETVRNIIRDGWRDKTAIWNVNTEKEYHEEK